MKGILFSIMAGVFISFQGVFNSKLSEALSPWHTTTIVHLVGFFTSFIIFLLIRDVKSGGFREVPFPYLLGGMFGVVIVIGEMTAINRLGMSLAIATLLISQLLCAFMIDARGYFGVIKLKVTSQQIVGMLLIFIGIIIFNM